MQNREPMPFGYKLSATPAEIAEHVAKPIIYDVAGAAVAELKLGFKGRAIDFSWRPYAKRTPAARADYDRLRESIRAKGIQSPIITYQGHVLIGMRRVEIARELGIEHVTAANILEDVRLWWKHDIHRLDALKRELGIVSY